MTKEKHSVEETSSDSSQYPILNSRLERRVVRKIDMFTLPVIMLLYIVSFLDRSNIGNAKIAGLPEDIGLTGTQFNTATSIFYVTYIVFDVPMTILVKRYGPALVLPSITIAWSLVAIFSGFIENYAGLLVIRLLLGVCEAGLFPGLNFYVSLLYKRTEISKRICCIFVAMALSGAFGGLLAYAIIKMDGLGGKSGWRWLFIIEGLASIVVGCASFWLLPNSVETAYFLDREEQQCARVRLEKEYCCMDSSYHSEFKWIDVKDALTSINVWLSGIVQLGANTYLFGFSIFLPSIIEGMNYNSIQAQYLTIPVYITGALFYFVVSVFADRLQWRFVFMMGGLVLVFIGYGVLLGDTTQGVLFMATFFVAAGGYIVPGLNITWLNANTAGPYKRATAIGFNQSLGNIGGVIAGQIYRPQDAPRYIIGHGTSIGGAGLALVAAIALLFVFKMKNKGKERRRTFSEVVQYQKERGDESKDFRYYM